MFFVVKRILLTFLCISALLAGGIAQSIAATSAPVATLSTTRIDMGNIAKGASYNATVIIINEGDAPLYITDISTTCGCTAALLDNQTIQPGMTGNLQIRFNSRGFQGRVSKEVSILTNEGKRTRHRITLFGNVQPEITPEPRSLYIPLPSTREGEGTVTLKNRTDKPQTVRIDGPRDYQMKASLADGIIPAGGSTELTVRVKLKYPQSEYSGRLYILTPDAKDHRFRIPVYARSKR